MMNIAIVGCGPAGLSSAILLHDLGYSVTLFERFDKAQAVGSGLMLQPTGLQVLAQVGLRDTIEKRGQRIDGMLGKVAPDGKTVLDINYRVLSDDLYGIAIHRASLFHVLFEAVQQRGIKLITNHDVVDIRLTVRSVELILPEGGVTANSYDFVIDASGGQSKLLAHAVDSPTYRPLNYGALWGTVRYDASQFNHRLLEQRYKAAKVMVGVMPCGKLPDNDTPVATFFWSLRDGDYQTTLDAGIAAWREDVLQHWPAVEPLLAQIASIEALSHAVYSHHTLPKPYGENIVFIGDAAHSTSPQLGQGANMALLDSMALAKALKSSRSHYDAFKLYARMRSKHVKVFQAASFLLTPFYQSDNTIMPWMRDRLFEPVSKIPLADKLVTSLGAGVLTSPVKKINKLSSG